IRRGGRCAEVPDAAADRLSAIRRDVRPEPVDRGRDDVQPACRRAGDAPGVRSRVMPPKPFDEPIYVTRPLLPPLETYTARLREVWQSRWLTNGGEQHERLTHALR